MAATVQNSKEPERSHDDKPTQLLLQHYCESIPEKNRHKLSKRLDFEHDGVQKHLGEIADSMDEWEGRVAEELMLTKVDIAYIKTEHPLKLDMQTRAALSKWQEKFGLNATYLNLMKAFLKAKKTSFAEAVCKVLTNTSSVSHASTTDIKMKDSGLRRMLSDCSSVSDQRSMEESLTSNSLRLSSFGESSVENDPELELNSDEQVKSDIQVFQRRFADLVVKTVIDLQTKQKATEFVAKFVTSIRFGLTQPFKGQYVEYMKKNAKRLKELGDIDEVMAELVELWTFVDYHLVEYIINQFGSEELNKEMKTFTAELKVFRSNTTVSKFAKYWPEKKLYPPEYREMDIKIDVDPNCWTLEDLENARKEMCTKLDEKNPHPYPSRFAILVSEVKEGCVVVALAVPREFLSTIIRCELNESLITEPKVLSIKIDGVVLDKMMLLNVCSQGKVELVRSLIESGVDPNHEVKEDNSTALHMASQNGNREIVELLLKSKANVEAKKKNEATPLLMASYAGHTDVVELLLSKGANPNAKTNEGQTPLMVVSKKGRLDLVQLLVDHNADVNLHSTNNVTPLGYASYEGHTDIVELLLEKGADVNALNQVGRTALSNASSPGHVETVRVLLKHGAATEIDLKSQRGATPLHYAAQGGHLGVIELLLEHGADIEETNQPGGTALSIAIAAVHINVVKLLLSHGANVNATTGDNEQTPLMFASLIGDMEMVRLILKYHPIINARSKNDITALMLATQGCHDDVVDALLMQGADPNLAEKETGWAPLHVAVKHSHFYITKMLLEHRAEPEANGVSAFDIMRVLSRDHEAVSEAFEELGIKEEKGNKISEASTNKLRIQDQLLLKVFTQHATELHVQDEQKNRFLHPELDYVSLEEGQQQTSIDKEPVNFQEEFKDSTITPTRTKDYTHSGIFGFIEKLVINGEKCVGRKYRNDLLDYQDQPRLLDAIKRLECLSHKNIAKMNGVCFYDDLKYPVIVTEIFDTTLDKKDLKETSLDLRMSVLNKVAHGLAYLHKQGITHYSLTAQNVRVSETLEIVKIGGIEDGQIVDRQKLLAHNQDTPSIAVYMPPEVSKPEFIYTQFDIFSFGHLAMCFMIVEFSTILLPTEHVAGQEHHVTGMTELERRQGYVSRMDKELESDYRNVSDLIKRCLFDKPQKRPKAQELKEISPKPQRQEGVDEN